MAAAADVLDGIGSDGDAPVVVVVYSDSQAPTMRPTWTPPGELGVAGVTLVGIAVFASLALFCLGHWRSIARGLRRAFQDARRRICPRTRRRGEGLPLVELKESNQTTETATAAASRAPADPRHVSEHVDGLYGQLEGGGDDDLPHASAAAEDPDAANEDASGEDATPPDDAASGEKQQQPHSRRPPLYARLRELLAGPSGSTGDDRAIPASGPRPMRSDARYFDDSI